MEITLLKAKIHRAVVTQADLNYVGSITIDSGLLREAGILEYEKVEIADIDSGERDSQKIIDIIRESLETEPMARIDYVEVVDFENIQRTPRIEGETLVAIAVYIGKTRLIDNFIVNE